MRWIIWIFLVTMAFMAMALALLAVFQPDLAKILIGLLGYRLGAVGLVMSLVVAAMTGWLAFRKTPSRSRTFSRIVVVLAVGACVRFVLTAPAYELESVRYPSGAAELVGELYLPEAADPVPAVVLVHGSAPFPRTTYDLWADFLTNNGVAVLLVDKRGVGDSGGEFESRNNGSLENLNLLASDVVAGVEFLSARPDIDAARIGLYGISQAGWVGVLAARKTALISFMIMNSGPTVSIGEESKWSDLRGDDHGEALVTMAEAEAELERTEPRHYDPRTDLSALNIPALWLFADTDNSIPVKKSIQILDRLITHDKPFSHRTYESVGHVLLGGPKMNSPMRVAERSWTDTANWLTEVLMNLDAEK